MRATAILLIAVTVLILASQPSSGEPRESVYDRVLRTGTIRCGYIVWPPFMDKDPKTDSFSGMNYEYAEAVASVLGLKIEWTAEIGPGENVEALRSGKIDAVCTAEGPLIPSTIRYLSYSEPFAYFPFHLYGRADDHRFDADVAAVNNPSVRIAVIDGDISTHIAQTSFPKAAHDTIPQVASPTQMMLDVATGKADIVINDPFSMKGFITNNPGKLRRIGPDDPVAVIPNTFSVLRGSDSREFLDLLNQAIENVKYTGKEKLIFEKYKAGKDLGFYPTALPYSAP
jgi:ABC-type amino acid transport substrate-binding protein